MHLRWMCKAKMIDRRGHPTDESKAHAHDALRFPNLPKDADMFHQTADEDSAFRQCLHIFAGSVIFGMHTHTYTAHSYRHSERKQ